MRTPPQTFHLTREHLAVIEYFYARFGVITSRASIIRAALDIGFAELGKQYQLPAEQKDNNDDSSSK